MAFTTPAAGAPAAASSPKHRPWLPLTVVAAVLVVIVVAILLWLNGDDDKIELTEATPTVPTTTATPTASPTQAKPTDKATKPTPKTPSPAAPGSIVLSKSSIDLGRKGSTSSVALTNTGGKAVAFQISSGAGWLSAAPTTGTLQPGATAPIGIRADRGEVREGTSSGSITVTWSGGRASTKVSLTQERAPLVGRPSLASNTPCDVNKVSVSASDPSGLSKVVLRWSSEGGSGSRTMSGSGATYTTSMGTITGGSVRMSVTATDKRGNTATGPSRTVQVNPCPQ